MQIFAVAIPKNFFETPSKKSYIDENLEQKIIDDIKIICQKLELPLKIFTEKDILSKNSVPTEEEKNPSLLKILHQWINETHPLDKNSSIDDRAIAIIPIVSEFYNLEQNKRLLKNFIEYQPDIGFADNFPSGMLFTFVRADVLLPLENLREKEKLGQDFNFVEKIIEKDINAFDLENLYAPIGLQTFRLDFQNNDQHNHLLAKSIKEKMQKENSTAPYDWKFEDFAKLILQNRSLLKSVPKYYQWHLSSLEAQKRLLSPYELIEDQEKKKQPISFDDFKIILGKITATTDEPVICFSASITEPTLNNDWKKIIKHCLDQNICVLLETSGATLTKEDIDQLSNWSKDLFTIIFLLETINQKTYETFRSGNPPLKQILNIVEDCLLKKPEKTFVEITKTNENIDELFDFHAYFKKFTKNIIVNKYNTYRGQLPERRARVMEPLNRIDCWHLKRDLVIDWSGDVWMCKQDIKKQNLLGNLLKDKMENILQKNDMMFKSHLNNFDFCKNCDEYYTFNF